MARGSELDILGSNDFNVNSVFRQLAVFLLLFFVRGGGVPRMVKVLSSPLGV